MGLIDADVSELIGHTMASVERINDGQDDVVYFRSTGGTAWRMYHRQDCCESVTIEDICGDLNDLVGSPILMAEESSNGDDPPDICEPESYTWTFYKFATAKGYVTIRWYGESNGYYSESVDFEREVTNDLP